MPTLQTKNDCYWFASLFAGCYRSTLLNVKTCHFDECLYLLLLQLYLLWSESKICILLGYVRIQMSLIKNWLFERWMWSSQNHGSYFLAFVGRLSVLEYIQILPKKTYIEIRSVPNLIWQLNLSPYKRNKQGIKKIIQIPPWINAFADVYCVSFDRLKKNSYFRNYPAFIIERKKIDWNPLIITMRLLNCA